MSTRLSMNTAFRPRPIDINRPLEIHRGILPTEADGCVRGVPSMPTGMEPEEEEEAHIQEAIAASLAYTTSADVEIPTPICKVVDGYDTAPNPRPYVPGNTYAFYRGEDIENTIEYDIDSEDEEFLSNLNQSKMMLSEDKLEYIIDKLEKEAHVHHTSINDLNLAKIETLFKAHDYGLKKELLPILLEYWKMKKEAKSGLSLTLRFAKPPAFDDPSPYVAFRPREKDKDKFKKIRKNDSASLVKMRALRQEMERSRTLLEMIKKREKLKKDQFTVFAMMFERLLVENSFKTEEDTKQPQQKKKKVAPTTSPPPFSSSLSPIASPVDHTPKPKPVPKSRPDYYYDISSVNTRIKFDPSLAAVPYVLQKPPPSSSVSSISSISSSSSIVPPPSSSISSSSSSIANPRSLYPSFLQVLQRRPPRSFFLENEEEEDEDEDEDEEETFEDRFLFEDDEKEREERENTEESLPRTPDVVASIAKLDEDAVFPRKVEGYIAITRESTPFRGRARLGRGGRILFDRPLSFPSSSRLSSSSVSSSSSSSAAISSSSPSSSSIPPSSANSYNNNNINHNNNYSNTNQLNTSNSQHVTNTHEDESIDNNENNNSLDNNNNNNKDNNDTNDNMDDNDINEDAHDESMVDSNINSEPEAKLYFNHRTSPSHSSLSSSSKLFSSSQPILDSHTSPLPSSSSPCTDKIDKIDKIDKTDKFDQLNNTTKIDKMPTTVLHNYSKNQKRKLVDTSSIPSISM